MKEVLRWNDKKEIYDKCVNQFGIVEGYIIYINLMKQIGESTVYG
jgi:hypothetical protein